ncbi:MAG: spondin domain-containing protein [Pseudomonadota bacterium]
MRSLLRNPVVRISSFTFLIALSSALSAATYKVSFVGLWNGTHVTSGVLPPGAHFTELVGATHVTGATFWTPGTAASNGVEAVAEGGNIFPLLQELTPLIGSGQVDGFIEVSDISGFPTTATSTFDIFQSHPEVSLISMIAPSPDWFVGVRGVALHDGTSWTQQLSVDLIPWDAGTEDGNGFSLSNPATSPQGVISNVFASPFVGQPVIGRIEFELLAIPVPASLWMLLSAVAVLLRQVAR